MKFTHRIASWLALPLLFSLFLVYNKVLLLKVPKIGFLLHAMAGGKIPGYIDDSIFERHEEWLKAGDVVLSVPAKSGTTWMMYTLHQLRNKGKAPDFRDIYEEVPWAEFVYYPGQSRDERIQHMTNITSRSPLRIYKSHAAPPKVPFRHDVKYVIVIRNPFDVAASGRDFFANHHKKFARMWGDFPPGAGEDTLLPDAEWNHMLLVDRGDGVPMADVFLFEIFKNWWPLRNQSNVLFMHYSDRVKNDYQELHRLSKFLNLSITPEELQTVVDQVTFKETKKIQSKFENKYALDKFKERGLIPKDVSILRTDVDGAMVNKGPKRNGVDELNPGLRDGIAALVEKHFPSKAIQDWFLNGGRLPVEADL